MKPTSLAEPVKATFKLRVPGEVLPFPAGARRGSHPEYQAWKASFNGAALEQLIPRLGDHRGMATWLIDNNGVTYRRERVNQGRFQVDVIFYRPVGARGDLANLYKAVEDSLKGLLWHDDTRRYVWSQSSMVIDSDRHETVLTATTELSA